MGIRLLKMAFVATASVLLMTAVSAGPAAAQATVFRDACGVDSGDIPGLPAFAFADAHVVVLPGDDGLVVTCTGSLPDGLSVSQTYQGPAPCTSDGVTFVRGHIVATVSGQISIFCRFPRA